MIERIEKLGLTKSQAQIIEELVNIIDMQIHEVFEKDMNFVLTINDSNRDNRMGFSFSNLHRDKVFQMYIDIFFALKTNMKKTKRIDFTRKLVSGLLQNNEEKKACFYWLLDELHREDNVYRIKS